MPFAVQKQKWKKNRTMTFHSSYKCTGDQYKTMLCTSEHWSIHTYTHDCLKFATIECEGKKLRANFAWHMNIPLQMCDGGKLLKILAKASSSTVCVLHFYYKPKKWTIIDAVENRQNQFWIFHSKRKT